MKQALEWRSIRPEDVEGKGWRDTLAPFDRLPAHAKETVPPNVWNLSHHSAGICLRFVTASTRIGVRWSVGGNLAMPHMAATGVSGVDLYRRGARRRWTFVGVGQPRQQQGNEATFPGATGGPTEFLLYFPLYNDTTGLEVGLEGGAPLLAPPPRTRAQVDAQFARLCAATLVQRRSLLAEPARAEVIVGGAAVLSTIMKEFDIDELLVSEPDILDVPAGSLVAS